MVHLLVGVFGGMMDAMAICPWEMVETRLPSSSFNYMGDLLLPPTAQQLGSTTCPTVPAHHHCLYPRHTDHAAVIAGSKSPGHRQSVIFNCFQYIMEIEDSWVLFWGLGPNLVGVVPSTAIYFCSYSQMKKFLSVEPEPIPSHRRSPFPQLIKEMLAGIKSWICYD
ncbi:Solute carrier family 25 member 36-A [Portunus trituberculatus]|uniref:Solute carrier family 25 member 36-A n=1 Tax=Portunus trituberculatus TaxID=210409 RepID=A0A5B7GL18_PORTR|nr:Solute carrier family 25 member 36-A [Portunus trituberculatus]